MGRNEPERAAALRVLIVRVGAMGDVLHGLPAVAALRQEIPECFIGWAIEPRWAELLRAGGLADGAAGGPERPVVDMIHAVPTRDWKRRVFHPETLGSILKVRREMRAQRYDVCVDLQGAIRSAVIGRMAGATRFYGPDAPREREARWLYGERVRTTAAYVVDQACQILGAACGRVLVPGGDPLPVDAAAEAWAEGLLSSLGLGDGAPFVVMAPTAGWGAKEWPAERFHAVALALKQAGYGVLVNASARGDETAERVARDGAGVVVPCGIGEMTSLLRRARLMIGGDTGPVHLAAALGTPVLALYGPTDPARTGPYGLQTRVLRDASSVTDHRRHRETEAGLLKVTVEEVVAGALKLLRETNG